MKAEIIIYSPSFNSIGGIETFTYNLAKQLTKKYDVLVVTNDGADEDQLNRLRLVARVSYNDKKFECKYLIKNSIYMGDVIDCKVEELIFGMVHADYKYLLDKGLCNYQESGTIDRYLSVSKLVRNKFLEAYNIDSKVMYNILDDKKDIKKPKKVFNDGYKKLRLVSACRLSPEKGYDRMLQLAKELNKRDIPFEWKLFCQTDIFGITVEQVPNVIYCEPKLDISQEFANADYGVQLSDTEGYSYFIHECQQIGTPTITTAFPSIFETTKNGHILPFELFTNGTEKDWDKTIQEILDIPEVNYTEMCSIKDWEKIMTKLEKRKDTFIPEKTRFEKSTYIALENMKDDEGNEIKVGEQPVLKTSNRIKMLIEYKVIKRKED